MTPEGPHQRTLWTGAEANVWFRLSLEQRQSLRQFQSVDFFYATRFQKERHDGDEASAAYPPIDQTMLKDPRYKQTQVMHPLPRVDELSYELDHDPRGLYFRQACVWRARANGADRELAGTLSVVADPTETAPLSTVFVGRRHPLHQSSLRDPRGERTRRYLIPKFWIVDEERVTLRCVYCDFEREPRIVSRASTKKYSHELHEWRNILERTPHDLVLFSTEQEAIDAGYQLRRSKKRPSALKRTDSYEEVL